MLTAPPAETRPTAEAAVSLKPMRPPSNDRSPVVEKVPLSMLSVLTPPPSTTLPLTVNEPPFISIEPVVFVGVEPPVEASVTLLAVTVPASIVRLPLAPPVAGRLCCTRKAWAGSVSNRK